MMRTTVILLIILAIIGVSCENNDPGESKPVIDFHELGLDNSKTATAGDELHLDAEILAENKIERIEIEIHPEGDEHKKGFPASAGVLEWEFDSIYTEGFSGLKNAEFHKHIDVPEYAEPGHYHFHFAVIDMEGYQTVHEDEVEIQAPGSPK